MKNYKILLPKYFPKKHLKEGQRTNFRNAIINGTKIHAICQDVSKWETRIKEVQKGQAVLSIKEWTESLHKNIQKELLQLSAKDGVGFQKAVLSRSEWPDNDNILHCCYWITINEKEIDIDDFCHNEGLCSFTDVIEWFATRMDNIKPDKEGWRHQELAIIHFSNFRY